MSSGRFLLPVLPNGFHRIRHYGLLANSGRKNHIATVRELLHQPASEVHADAAQTHASNGSVRPTFVCRHCGAPMIILQTFARAHPSALHPAWVVRHERSPLATPNASSALHRSLPIRTPMAARRKHHTDDTHHCQHRASVFSNVALQRAMSADCAATLATAIVQIAIAHRRC